MKIKNAIIFSLTIFAILGVSFLVSSCDLTLPWEPVGYSDARDSYIPGTNTASDYSNNTMPSALFDVSSTGLYAGGTATLDASYSVDQDGDTLTYMWDLGSDGAFEITNTAASFTHVFNDPGPVYISLMVQDTKGGIGSTSGTFYVGDSYIVSNSTKDDFHIRVVYCGSLGTVSGSTPLVVMVGTENSLTAGAFDSIGSSSVSGGYATPVTPSTNDGIVVAVYFDADGSGTLNGGDPYKFYNGVNYTDGYHQISKSSGEELYFSMYLDDRFIQGY